MSYPQAEEALLHTKLTDIGEGGYRCASAEGKFIDEVIEENVMYVLKRENVPNIDLLTVNTSKPYDVFKPGYEVGLNAWFRNQVIAYRILAYGMMEVDEGSRADGCDDYIEIWDMEVEVHEGRDYDDLVNDGINVIGAETRTPHVTDYTTEEEYQQMLSTLRTQFKEFEEENESFHFNEKIVDKQGNEAIILVDFGIEDYYEGYYYPASVNGHTYHHRPYEHPEQIPAFDKAMALVEKASRPIRVNRKERWEWRGLSGYNPDQGEFEARFTIMWRNPQR